LHIVPWANSDIDTLEEPPVHAARPDWAEAICDYVDQLGPDEAAIINGTFWEGLERPEIARRLNTAPSSVSRRLERILEDLALYLETQGLELPSSYRREI
jgi:DNA-directed RNA polymerase specialized sigma24 family protein